MGYSGISRINFLEVFAGVGEGLIIGIVYLDQPSRSVQILHSPGDNTPDRKGPRGKKLECMTRNEILAIVKEVQEEVPSDSVEHERLQNILENPTNKKDIEAVVKSTLILLRRLISV